MAYFQQTYLNTAKTEFMLIGPRQKLITLSSQPELSIDNVPIEKVNSANSLGIFIDENLRWQTQIDLLSKKIASGIGTIKRIRDFVSNAYYTPLYMQHFHSISIRLL